MFFVVIVVVVLVSAAYSYYFRFNFLDFLFCFQGEKRKELCFWVLLLLVGFVLLVPAWGEGGIVGSCFSFAGSNSCSDSCKGGKFIRGEKEGGKGWDSVENDNLFCLLFL